MLLPLRRGLTELDNLTKKKKYVAAPTLLYGKILTTYYLQYIGESSEDEARSSDCEVCCL
jgi:hypothetical protein